MVRREAAASSKTFGAPARPEPQLAMAVAAPMIAVRSEELSESSEATLEAARCWAALVATVDAEAEPDEEAVGDAVAVFAEADACDFRVPGAVRDAVAVPVLAV
jgi:hypothetical protein